jgi:hypothetical protein
MGNRIVITESQYGRLFLNEQDYSSKRKVLYDNGVTGLKQNGVETKFIPSYEEISNTPHEKTITTLYNMAGYEMVKDIEWFKEGYLGGSNSMCRWVDLIGYGNSGSNIKGIKLKDLNPDGDLGLKMDNRYGLPTNEYLDGSKKNMKTDFPWMVYWLLSDFRSGGGMSIEQHIIKGNSKILGDNNWIYGTQDINKIKSMIIQSQKDNYSIGNYMYSNDISYGCHMERDITGVEKLIDKVAQYLGNCAEDYHCVLDLLSIAALALPGVGLAVSAGIDFLNGMSYGVEAYNATNSADRNAAILAGGLTLFGGFLGGGIKQTNKILKYGSIDPKIYEYASDVMSTVQKEYKGAKSLKSIDPEKGFNALGKKVDPKLGEIYGQAAKKYGLNDNEVLLAHDLLKNFSKIDPAIAKQYANALGDLESKIGKGNLVLLGKDKGLKTAIDASGGDIIEGLSKHMGKVARKEAVMEGALFIALTEAMEQPSVQKWIGEKYNMLKYSGRKDIRGLVEKERYGWDDTKKVFGAVVKGTPEYSKERSEEDNTKLKQAWLKGWRPDKEPIEWLLKNPKYQTKGFKKSYGKYTGDDKVVRKVRPKDNKDVEDGVKYYDTEEELNKVNSMDDNVTEDEIETTGSIYEKYK